jgi:two-component system, chemotaxis family, sensor kinase CheA
MDSILQKFKSKFIDEAQGLLDKLEKDLLELEKTPDDKELIESAFRAMHTIKGVSGMYGFDFIADHTHHMESIYQAIREKKMAFDKEIFDVTFSSIDHIRKLLVDEKLENSETNKKHELLLEKIQLILCDTTRQSFKTAFKEELVDVEKSVVSTYNIFLNANEKIYFRGISLTNIFRELAELGEYRIEKLPNMSNDDSEMWSIFFSTETTLDQIHEVLMFIEDDCIIKTVGKKDLIEQLDEPRQNKSIKAEETIKNVIEQLNKKAGKSENNIISKIDTKQNSALITETIETTDYKNVISIHQEKQGLKRISVDSQKLDHLMFLVSELITVNSQLMQNVQNPAFEPLRNSIEKIDNLSKLFRNNALEIRLVPLSDTILRFQRLIRDLSNNLDKKVDLKTQGIETELDKNTVDQLSEPLMHIIRNCIDHGIETPELRVSKGKTDTGTIKISANQSGNYVYISIEDYGVGIDLDKIKTKAIEKGFIKPTDKLTKSEILDLIFLPGFSTAQSLTEVSGRGVGMDVVRKKIADLRGEVIVSSELGTGTSFTLKIQQSLSILDTLLFKVANSYFTIPVSDIELCDQIDICEIDKNRHTSTLSYNNELISFVDLRKALGMQGSYSNKTKEIIIKNNNITFAILADSIIGEHQAVLKPLGKAFSDHALITSASQLGDGHIAFMIDTNAITKNIAKLL